MDFKDGASVIANLTTTGRKTGQRRTVELRLVFYQGGFYVTSARVEGKHWCQNMLKNPVVELTVKGEKVSCVSKQVTDESLRRQILTLRDSPPLMERKVFEIRPGK